MSALGATKEMNRIQNMMFILVSKLGRMRIGDTVTVCLGRTCEAGHEHGCKISANSTANRTGETPWSQPQHVHNSLTSTPPRPRRTLNLLIITRGPDDNWMM